MSPIPLETAFEIIDNATAVICGPECGLTYAEVDHLNGEPDNEWLRLAWSSDKRDFAVKFNERANPRIHKGRLFLIDTEGDDNEITVLRAVDLKESNNHGIEE